MKTKSFYQKMSLLAVAFAGAALSVPAQALTVSLVFNKLPSAQGWKFSAVRGSINPIPITLPDTAVFSLSNGILHQNTLGQNELGAIYVLKNYANFNKPYSLTVRARVLAQDTGSEPYSFDFGFNSDMWFTGFAIGIGEIWDQHGTVIANGINTSEFHTYRFDGTPDGGYTFYIDGKFVAKGDGNSSAISPEEHNIIYFGDGTPSGSNAKGDIASYTFTQPSVTGNVKNLQPSYTIKCTNETTGQSVNILPNKLNNYDCEAKGLLKINPNDAVSVLIKGNSK